MSSEPKSSKKTEKTWYEQLFQDVVVGGTAGATAKTAMAPIERVKLLLQTMDSNSDIVSGKVKRYDGPIDCVKRVIAEQGASALWRGNLVNCLRYAPQQGSALAFNDLINNKIFPQYDSKTDFWKSLACKLAAGGTAGAVANTICYPLDFARTRLASDVGSGKGKYNGIFDCISSTVKAQGITGLYSGWSVTVAGVFVYRAGQLGCFAQIQDMNPYKEDKGMLGAFSSFASAILARTSIMPFNYPFDTVRRRMMLQSEKPKSERLYTGSLHCAKQIIQKEGVKGLYKGMIPELFRGVGGPLVIVAYDRVKVIFNL